MGQINIVWRGSRTAVEDEATKLSQTVDPVWIVDAIMVDVRFSKLDQSSGLVKVVIHEDFLE